VVDGAELHDAIKVELAARAFCDAVKAGRNTEATEAYFALRAAVFGESHRDADLPASITLGDDAYSVDAMRVAAQEWERTATEATAQLEEMRGHDWGAIDRLLEQGVLSQMLAMRDADPKVKRVVAMIWRDGNPVPGVAVAESLRVALEIATRAVAKSMMPPEKADPG